MTQPGPARSTLLTPPGTGAIGVIRVAGPGTHRIVSKLFRPVCSGLRSARTESCDSLFVGDRLRYGRFVVDDEVIDEVLVSRVGTVDPQALDISAHGGIGVVESILRALERHGAPFKEIGEAVGTSWPTRNLIEEEAVSDLARAKTQRAVRFLAWQRRHLASDLERAASLCPHDPDEAGQALEAMAAGFETARMLIDGAVVVILGPPNSGKSTLFNNLIGRSDNVVSPHPGTTRDWVTGAIEIEGVPLTLVDTAGSHESAANIERRAVRSCRAIAKRADLSLLLLDGSQPLTGGAGEIRRLFGSAQRRVTVITKADLKRAWDVGEAATEALGCGSDPILVSVRTGAGLDGLMRRLLSGLGFAGWVDKTACCFTLRQRDLTRRALGELARSPADACSTLHERLIGAKGL